jgi:hypothetical protein
MNSRMHGSEPVLAERARAPIAGCTFFCHSPIHNY